MTIILSTDSKYQSRKWFLRESGDEENKYEPWVWSLHFTLSDMRLHITVEIGSGLKHDGYDDVLPYAANKELNESEFISAKLTPGGVRRLLLNTSYSMFGTNRHISEFALIIRKVEEGKKESCSAQGIVSYTSNIDFPFRPSVTCDDAITFYIDVSPERFAKYAARICDKSIMWATLTVGRVHGFYSLWSPDIYTYAVKVLTGAKSHPVEIPEGCEIIPPRLGEVGLFELYLYNESKFECPTPRGIADDSKDDITNSANSRHETTQAPPSQLVFADTKTLTFLKSLRVAAWIIAALLLLILIKI